MESRRPQRTRTRNIVIRLNDAERALLDRIAKREGLSISELFRALLRRAAAGSRPYVIEQQMPLTIAEPTQGASWVRDIARAVAIELKKKELKK